jgi:hypothetical protein
MGTRSLDVRVLELEQWREEVEKALASLHRHLNPGVELEIENLRDSVRVLMRKSNKKEIGGG